VLEYEDVKEAMKYHRKMGIVEGFEKGLEKGMEKGEKKGREEGLQEGIEQGREETLRQMVAGMLKKGIDTSTIAEISGMSEEEIAALQS